MASSMTHQQAAALLASTVGLATPAQAVCLVAAVLAAAAVLMMAAARVIQQKCRHCQWVLWDQKAAAAAASAAGERGRQAVVIA